MLNIKIVLLIVIGAVVLYLRWLQSENIELKNSLNQEQEINTKLNEVYEYNKKLDSKLEVLKEELELKKDEVSTTHTKLKVEIAKRDTIQKRKENEKNHTSNNDDFIVISF